jgi:hypothetical protein
MYFIGNGTNKVFMPNSPYLQDNFRYLKYGVVDSIVDEEGMGRIKVRINGSPTVGGDGDTLTDKLPWAFPLLPKHISTIPKVGEVVWIFVMGKNSQHADRLYIGPIISQLDKLDEDKFTAGTALRPFTFGQLTAGSPVLTDSTTNKIIPELIGVFPKADEISIQGRFNTDITQKNNEVVIRAGKFEPSDSNKYKIAFNRKTQGFIQIKNGVKLPSSDDSDATETGTVTNIVSSKINLLTHKNGSPTITLNQENLISDEELTNILKDAHQLPFGDILLDYLRLLKEAIFSHVHNGNGNPATDLSASGNVQAVAALKSKAEDLEKRMLSKNIRIN